MSRKDEIRLNPLSWHFLLVSVEFAAKIAKKVGILDMLDKAASKTKTDIDDKAVKITKAILETLSGEAEKPVDDS